MRLISDDVLAIATIYQEARGEPYVGKVGVGEVIRERTDRRFFSRGTVASTVLWPMQFSGWNQHDPNRTPSVLIDDQDPIVQECMKAWEEAKAGSVTVNGAVLYCNPAEVSPGWALRARLVAEIGHHRFYV